MFSKKSSEHQEYQGKEVTDAIKSACESLGVTQDQLEIEVVSAGSAGIFGLIRKKAKIRVTVKKEFAANVEGTTDKPEVRNDYHNRGKRREQEDIVEATQENIVLVEGEINKILELMSIDATVESSNVNGTLNCVIKTEAEKELTDQAGRVLDSLQYIVRKIAVKKIENRIRINLDVNNFRQERLEGLKVRAVELAEKVKEDGRTQVITSLNPSERRTIHMILQEDKDIRSRSVGDGLFKKILIYKPGKGNRGGRRRAHHNSNRKKNQRSSHSSSES